jgi:hypothetical protein
VSRRALRCSVLAVAALLVAPAASLAGPLDIPAAVPPRFRALVRAQLDSMGVKSHSPQTRSPSTSRFDLKTRQGYSISVLGVGREVVVAVTPKRGTPRTRDAVASRRGSAVTAYVARGTVTGSRIEASFGELGRVAVRFHPSGRILKSKPRRRCRGVDRFTSRLGVFTGSIRFTGEGHYVSVRAHRAKGQVRSPLHLHCASADFQPLLESEGRQLPGNSAGFNPTFLDASWRQAVASSVFLALKLDKRALFLALAEQSKGSVAEVRYGFATGTSRAFASDDALTSATVTPPWPFKGKGDYKAAPDGTKTWTGSLSVAFPGAARFPLTGSQFTAGLAAGF